MYAQLHILFKYALCLIATYNKNCKTINFKFGIVIPLML